MERIKLKHCWSFVLILIFILTLSIFSFAQEQDEFSHFANNPKLNFPDQILDDFRAGETTTRVIVNLQDPEPNQARVVRPNFIDMTVREEVVQQVTNAQDQVINSIDLNEVRITNRFTYIFGFSAEVTAAGLEALLNNPGVVSIDEDPIVHAHLAQGIPLINALTTRTDFDGYSMSIAILDTGIDYNHPRLGGGSFPNDKVIGGYDTGQDDSDPIDGNGHGTACAGIAAGDLGTVGDYIGGVAPNAKLYALKMSSTATGGSALGSDMVEAVEWCITHQYDDPSHPIMILSMSFGGGRYTSEASCDAALASMTTAAANARAAGMSFFVSTGNDGFCDGTGWPGCLSDVIGVGAVYDANIGTPGWCIRNESCIGQSWPSCGIAPNNWACFETSTAADQVTCYSNSASFMEVFASSNNAHTTGLSGGYNTTFGGTSAACPYAAGAGAALQSASKAIDGFPLTPDQMQSYLETNGDAITDGKVAITKPRVNLGNTVTQIGDELPADFGTNGLWRYTAMSWSKMSNWNPDDDMSNWSGGLGVDFGTNGLWNFLNSVWSRLATWNVGSGGLAGWIGGLAADFDGNGLWNFNGTAWALLSSWNPDNDLTGWFGGLAIDFGTNGLWNYRGSSWSRLSGWNPGTGGLTGWSMGLAVDFDANGFWNFNGSSWSRLATWNPEGSTSWPGGLAVDFGANGLWNWDGTTWEFLSSWDPGATLTGMADGLVVDFGANGLWKWSGLVWIRMSIWSAENMDGADLG